ncbi:MAG TPA: antitoxin Xre/MbcA/ParS toxin-binding domain-containing protein [Tepidisphaeraceae bacterium]|jgi:putative toxin-antitoxin system antitoxin component (TIGR02293 family)
MADALNMPLQSKRLKPNHPKAHPMRGRSLGMAAGSTATIVQQVRRGFPYSAIVRFHQSSGLPVGRIAELVGIPQRTLMRRKAKGRLNSGESERLLRVSGIFEKAIELFEGDADGARRWLTKPSKELDDQAPLDFARTEIGAREVEDLIGRLEHGVFT